MVKGWCYGLRYPYKGYPGCILNIDIQTIWLRGGAMAADIHIKDIQDVY